MKQIGVKQIVAFSLGLAFISFSSVYTEQALSNNYNFAQLIAKRVQPVRWNPPNLGAPGNRKPGAARNNCPITSDKSLLLALVPPTNIGLTVSDRPTFWFYTGSLPATMRTAEFILQNPNGADIYRGNFPLPEKPGIINFTLPSQQRYSLEADRKYTWYFKVYCGTENTKDYIFVKGAVQRKAASLPQDYITYASEGIWYDAITNLANQYKQKPQDPQLQEDWAELLQSVGLDEISQQPLQPYPIKIN